MTNTLQTIDKELLSTTLLAMQLRTSNKVILENAKKCLPNKIIENGKNTYWNQEEITIIIEYLKENNKNQHTFTGAVKSISTSQTPAFKIQKAMELMREGYEEALEIERQEKENLKLQIQEDKPKVDLYNTIIDNNKLFSINEVSKLLQLPYGNITLFKKLRIAGVLRTNNTPYQKDINLNRFTLKETTKIINGKTKIFLQTLCTNKGIEYIKKIVE